MAKKFAVPLNTLVGRPPIRVRKIGGRSPADTPAVNMQGMNEPETMIYSALTKLGINFESQKAFAGGATFGGAKMDFFLPDYSVDLEYNGPFHGTTEGKAKDLLRTASLVGQGIRVVILNQFDLPNLKRVILEKIGVPIIRTAAMQQVETE